MIGFDVKLERKLRSIRFGVSGLGRNMPQTVEVNTEDLSAKPVIDVDCCIFPLAVVECIEEMYSYHRKNEYGF
ncbi:hypothetical protein IFM89_014073 [Coptis chinensis]|uniref:Uncharacterized protein n=1 Tax=Coptis chinensis TaxID=261450 RepID=A0A835HJT0_9MAGN|nr:hypothetical protein IFM89_014073 [Coptis chinensis]